MEIQQTNHGAVTVLKPIGPLCEEDADAVKTQTIEASARSASTSAARSASGVGTAPSERNHTYSAWRLTDVTASESDAATDTFWPWPSDAKAVALPTTATAPGSYTCCSTAARVDPRRSVPFVETTTATLGRRVGVIDMWSTFWSPSERSAITASPCLLAGLAEPEWHKHCDMCLILAISPLW